MSTSTDVDLEAVRDLFGKVLIAYYLHEMHCVGYEDYKNEEFLLNRFKSIRGTIDRFRFDFERLTGLEVDLSKSLPRG